MFWQKKPKTGVEDASHFVKDYQLYVRNLFLSHPADEAASLAVGGGDFDAIGRKLLAVVIDAGWKNGDSIIDLGCGSGRLAKLLSEMSPNCNYLGTDVAPELLDYAAARAPVSYRFQLHTELNFPAADESTDLIVAFSVFTHLFHEESYTYLLDALRVLKSGGRFVFSFLEADRHWNVFSAMLSPTWVSHKPHLNMFIERSAIEVWARRSGFAIVRYDVGPPIGQSVVVLQKQ